MAANQLYTRRPAHATPGRYPITASGQKSGSHAASDRTASNPAVIRPRRETTCIDRMQSSRRQAGMDLTYLDGRQIDRLDDMVGIGRRDQGHRRPAPRTGTIVKDPEGRLTRPGGQPAQPRAGTKARFPAIIARANSVKPGLITAIPRCSATMPASKSGRTIRPRSAPDRASSSARLACVSKLMSNGHAASAVKSSTTNSPVAIVFQSAVPFHHDGP